MGTGRSYLRASRFYEADRLRRPAMRLGHGAEPPDIQVRLVSAISNETLAVHVVEEHISTGGASSAVLLATNVYRRYDTGWLMVEHHGSVVHAQSEAHTVQ